MALEIYSNPLRGKGLSDETGLAVGDVETSAEAAVALYEQCPVHHTTPLHFLDELAASFGVGKLWLKMEDQRMGLGSFKALGATYAIAKRAAARVKNGEADAMDTALRGETYICASAGNHGLSMAAGAKLFGAQAVVLLSETVPEAFADRLRAKGADVQRAGANYEESMTVSKRLAAENGWNLLSDGTWLGYSQPARDVMEGYLIMGAEIARDIPEPPSHIFLQAGVGGLAAAMAASVRSNWESEVKIVVVEPEAAPALIESVKAGTSIDTEGPVSSMGRLDCKTPSHLALKYLAREADFFVTIDDELVGKTVSLLADHGVATSPSGAAGVAALHHASIDSAFGLNKQSHVLCIVSEERA